jgi:RNA polymerase sigma-70 factor (ECF subfamily)
LAEAGTVLSEEALVKAARGDQTAFAELVRAHQARVFSLAYHFLRDRSLAEELAQEVFLDLYRNISAIKSPTHLGFWLRKVATNRCIDYTRRAKSRPQISLEEIQEPVAAQQRGDHLLNETLRRLVAALPETPRMVMILRYQEDLDPTEIAKVLDMSINTVKSHLRRSLSILREKLSRHVGDLAV